MKMIKEEEQGNRHSSWFKSFERNLIASLTKIQEFFLSWRNFLLSAEFWSMAWLWRSFWLKMCSLWISFSVGGVAKRSLMSWVSSQVPEEYLAKEFPACFRNGVLLCALIEKIVPGACPRFDLLDPDQSLRNLKLALHLIEKFFKIKSPITVREFLQEEGLPEKSLLLLIAQIKTASEKFGFQVPKREPIKHLMSQTTFVSEKCFARGMGLLLAVRGRKACFTILLDSMEELDMVIEIRGPKNTACSKRITSAYSLSKSEPSQVDDVNEALIKENIMSKQIPLEYTILGRKVSIRYTPIESGTHSLNIIWQGQHIMGSPYTITVDESIDAPDVWHKPNKRSHSPLRKLDIQGLNGSGERKKASSHPKSRGTVMRKRIIRYIVKMDGNDVIIDGKEDLCEAINKIKKQQKKIQSVSAESCELNEDSEYLLQQEFEDIERSINFDDRTDQELSPTSNFFSEFNEDQRSSDADPSDLVNLKDFLDMEKENDSPDLLKEKELIYQDAETEEHSENYFDVYHASGSTDGKMASDCKNVDRHEYKSIGDIFKLQSFDTVAEVYAHSSSEESENFDVNNDIERKNLINKGNKSKKRNKYPVFENKRVKRQSSSNTNSFSDNDMNSDVNEERSQLSASDDLFFPVHKVQYEMLHDDDEDTDDHIDYPVKRRTSFTELHESNYLDDDIEELESTGAGVEEHIISISERNNDSEEFRVYQNTNKHFGAEDMRNCLRANHDLFQCDHSLSFWSETVTSTPPDFERNSLESNPENNFTNTLDSPESAATGFDRMLLELGNIVSSETFSVGCEETNPLENSFFELKDSDFYTPISFSPEESEVNEQHNDGDLELLKKYLLRELPDNKRRVSWPDRDLLPSIKESSFEGIMDLESYNDKIKNKEIRENSDSTLNIVKTETPCVSESSSPKRSDAESENKSNMLSDKLDETVEAISLSSDDAINMTKSPSKNKVSNTCNIKEREPKKLSEIKFTTCTYLERHLPHTSPANNSTNYILTHATPVMIDDASENVPLSSNSSETYLNSQDHKPPQCLSVKRVVQIFQQEKEEPLDMWPGESQNIKTSFKTFKDDALKSKSHEKDDFLNLEYGQFSRGEISRSSIKDRVRIFECDKNKNSYATKQKNNGKIDSATTFMTSQKFSKV